MAVVLVVYHTLAFFSLFSYGIYHLILSTRSSFKSPSSHIARPYHPLPLPPHRPHLLRHLPLYLSLLSLLLSISHYLLLSLSSSSSSSSSLSLSSLHTCLSLSLFLLLALSHLSHPLPPDLSFLLSSLAFFLLSLSPPPPRGLSAKTHSLSASISLASALFALALALAPKLFLLEIALAASVSLQGLWSLQTGLSLYVDAFIPDGCHRLLHVGDPTTRCDLDDSRVRAGQLLDLALAAHAVFVAVVAVVVYAAVARACGGEVGERGLGLGRRHNGGSYEALPTAGSGGALSDLDHVQMKAIGKSSAQA